MKYYYILQHFASLQTKFHDIILISTPFEKYFVNRHVLLCFSSFWSYSLSWKFNLLPIEFSLTLRSLTMEHSLTLICSWWDLPRHFILFDSTFPHSFYQYCVRSEIWIYNSNLISFSWIQIIRHSLYLSFFLTTAIKYNFPYHY